MGELTRAEALQRMAWAAASGGAHGRRRGAALGRFLAWYTAALIVDAPWPVQAPALGELLEEVRWYRWDEGVDEEGWALRLAVEHRAEGWAAAVAASDVLQDDDAAGGRRSSNRRPTR
jgi:hypothetical protein